jgi:NAD(P)-dependent dehydrogenase (short-subunit alcohol dehydrogenase family)
VAVEAQVLSMFDKVDAKLGRLTALVNNAGVVDVATRVDAMDMSASGSSACSTSMCWAVSCAPARPSSA